MKNTFKEFARPTAEEYKEQWNNSLVVFDTNILLSLYLYSPETRTSMFDMMSDIKNQLWIPYQIGKEFYSKRINVIQNVQAEPQKIVQGYKAFLNSVSKKSCFYKVLSSKSCEIQKDIHAEAKKNKLEIFADKIADFIESTYDGKVGNQYTKEDCVKIDNEYKDKLSNNIICPGFKDSKKQNNAAGDFYIWKQMLEHAKAEKKNIIFVTDDEKEDWWWFSGGERIGARYELKKEFLEETPGNHFNIYNLSGFLKWYNQYKGVKINKKVEEEIKNYDTENTDRSDRIRRLSEALAKASSAMPKINTPKIGGLGLGLGMIDPLMFQPRIANPMNQFTVPTPDISKVPDPMSETLFDHNKYLVELLAGDSTINSPKTVSEDPDEK